MGDTTYTVEKRFKGPAYDIPECSPVFYNYLQAQQLYTLERLKEQYEAAVKASHGTYSDEQAILNAIKETIEKKQTEGNV